MSDAIAYNERQALREELQIEFRQMDDAALIALVRGLKAEDQRLCDQGYRGLINDPRWNAAHNVIRERPGLEDQSWP